MRTMNRARALANRRILPSIISEKIPEEEKEWKSKIFANIPKSLENGNTEEIDFWLNIVDNYISL